VTGERLLLLLLWVEGEKIDIFLSWNYSCSTWCASFLNSKGACSVLGVWMNGGVAFASTHTRLRQVLTSAHFAA
jgi:hypothetical protein